MNIGVMLGGAAIGGFAGWKLDQFAVQHGAAPHTPARAAVDLLPELGILVGAAGALGGVALLHRAESAFWTAVVKMAHY